MLFLIQEVCGNVPKKVIRRGLLWKSYYDESCSFFLHEKRSNSPYPSNATNGTNSALNPAETLNDLVADPLAAASDSSRAVERIPQHAGRPHRPLRTLVESYTREDADATPEARLLLQKFVRFLEKGLAVSPDQRMSAREAMADAFLA